MDLSKANNAEVVQLPSSTVALAVTVDSSITASTEVTLNSATNFIQVDAVSGGVYLKYNGTASASSFDEYIQSGGTIHRFLGEDIASIQVIEEASGAKAIIIEKA